VTFDGNHSDGYGGGIAVTSGSSAVCNECAFTANTGDLYAGAAYVYYQASLELVDSTLDGNEAGYLGGAMYIDDGDISLTRTAITANTAPPGGGGGAWIEYGGYLYADDTDWGLGGSENQPSDVQSPYFEIGYYQQGESFDCDAYGCQ
jgi:predicted outer membrane repeat protein